MPTDGTAQDLGQPLCAEFRGMLEGRTQDAVLLRALVDKLCALGFGEFSLEFVDSAEERFRIYAEEGRIQGPEMTDAKRAALAQALQEILDSCQSGSAVESTLHSTESFAHAVRETVFTVVNGRLHGLSNVREAQPDVHAAANTAVIRGRRLTLLIPLGVLAALLLLWQSGWIDRALAHDASKLERELGVLDKLLDVDVVQNWGRYRLEIRRGTSFPTELRGLDALRDSAQTAIERASYSRLADGGKFWLRLEDREGKTLAATAFETLPLLLDKDAVIERRFNGRIAARKLHLALESGMADR